jgi:hypothetical protein
VLAVLVVIDQLRADYLTRWQPLFVPDGFRRLTSGGAWFQNCHYPYSGTWTGPGHASIATGCSPHKHGIIANDWYDALARKLVNCVTPERDEEVVPAGSSRWDIAASPRRLLSPTLADALKDATKGKGRVVTLSLKDRSAVLPGGQRPDACYWAAASGPFITSTHYRRSLHPWMQAFNRDRVSDRWFGKKWERLRPKLDYERWSGPDDVPGEGGRGLTPTFPHLLAGLRSSPDRAYYTTLAASPFGNDVLLDLACRAIEAEKLGTRDVPDLLCLSFSSNDLAGHVWGPDSQEVLDTTLRTDLIVRDLLKFLDKRVGKGRYVVALTADHGVCPLPEVSRKQGREAARVDAKLLFEQAETFLDKEFPVKRTAGVKERWLDATRESMIFLNRSLLGRLRLNHTAVEQALAKWLSGQLGIQCAYTYTQLQAGIPASDTLGQQVWRSFHPARSPDVILIEKPYHLVSTYLSGTTHGSPHPYDTHVPLLVYGPDVVPGVRKDAITPQAVAAILARALNIPPPRDAQATVPEKLFRAGKK